MKEICKCICHYKGNTIVHIVGCCNRTYEKYINEDGTIDVEKIKNWK